MISNGMDPSRFLREALSFVVVLGGTSMGVATVGLDIAKQFFQSGGPLRFLQRVGFSDFGAWASLCISLESFRV